MELHHCVLKMPQADIPGGKWSVAFAPAVLDDGGWVVLFGAPGVSDFVWVLWAKDMRSASVLRRAGHRALEQSIGDAEMVQFLANLVAEGSLKPEREMKVGDDRHERLHGIVQQALWADGESAFLGADWRSGEFGGKF